MDHKILTDVLEYAAAAAIAIFAAAMLSDEIATPLWGALSDMRFR